MTTPPTLRTERLVLRPFRLTDAGHVQRLASDFAIADTTLSIPHPYEEGMAEDWIATHPGAFERGEGMQLAITLRGRRTLVGAVGLSLVTRFSRAELGYWVGQPYWNKGYCTEAARAVVDHGFRTMELHRVVAHHLARNPASGRVMEKLGMTREGVAREHIVKWDRHEDVVLYGILKREWGDGPPAGKRRQAP
jgi:RimJ/RimL family protein N-acetyltransferase